MAPSLLSGIGVYTLQGLSASVITKNGDAFTGVFFGAIMENHDSAYLLKMVQQTKFGARGEVNGVQESSASYTGSGEDYAMSFDIKDVVDLAIEGVAFDGQHKSHNGWSQWEFVSWNQY